MRMHSYLIEFNFQQLHRLLLESSIENNVIEIIAEDSMEMRIIYN